MMCIDASAAFQHSLPDPFKPVYIMKRKTAKKKGQKNDTFLQIRY